MTLYANIAKLIAGDEAGPGRCRAPTPARTAALRSQAMTFCCGGGGDCARPVRPSAATAICLRASLVDGKHEKEKGRSF
jgi:hypothetical protein